MTLTVSCLPCSLQVILYIIEVEKCAQVAKARMAKNHCSRRMKPRGSFSTPVSITVVPIG